MTDEQTVDSFEHPGRPTVTDPGRHRAEFTASGLPEAIARARHEFDRSVSGTTYRGHPYGFGGMRSEVSGLLYGLVRELGPRTLVETGVCNGVSTAAILGALERNGAGRLYSIDLPEVTDTAYAEGTFWSGKKGAAVPKGKAPGWLVPEGLRGRWELTLGRSSEELPPLLERLGTIDFFLHDSEHSRECMTFEYRAAWRCLRPGGVLASDDVTWNDAFESFAGRHRREIHRLTDNLAYLIK